MDFIELGIIIGDNEGDFFGLYPEANYGPNIDIYNGNAPFGFEMEGKKSLSGFKVAFGPELWWGANPAVLVKYSTKLGEHLDVTGIFHEDIDKPAQTVSSFAIPVPQTRRATLHLKTKVGGLGVELGGMWGGQPLVGRTFQVAEEVNGKTEVFQDQVQNKDTWGGKMKVDLLCRTSKLVCSRGGHGISGQWRSRLYQNIYWMAFEG